MIDQNLDQKIVNWLKNNKDTVIKLWMDLVRIPSVREEAAPGAPFGVPCAEAVKTAAGFFQSYGFDTQVEEGCHYALADYGTGGKTIALFGHSDVVPAGDGWIYTSPFEPVIRDGYMIARGSGDDKAGVMASLFAMAILKEESVPLKNKIRAFIGSNEESGMADIALFLKKEPMPDLSLVPDSAFPCSVGEKSILRLTATSKTELSDILDFSGGRAANVVLDAVTVKIKASPALRDEITTKIQGRGEFVLSEENGTLLLKATGASKHAGSPDGSVNAAALASRLLSGCETLCSSDREQMARLYAFLSTCHGESLGIAHEDPDFGKLTSANGIVQAENQHLSFTLDIRFGCSLDHLETERKLEEFFASHGWEMEVISNRKGFSVDKNHPLPEALASLYRELTSLEDAKPYRMAGGTYSRYLKNSFTIGVRAHVPNSQAVRPEMPEGHGGAHQRDESIAVDSFFQAVRTVAHYLVLCDRFLSEEAL